MTTRSFTQIDRSTFNLQGCGSGCIPICAKALASLHVLELAKGVSITVLGVALARLSRVALPCSVPVTCGIRDIRVSHMQNDDKYSTGWAASCCPAAPQSRAA